MPIDPELNRAVELCKLLCDANRAQVVRMLADGGEMHVTAICTRLEQSQPAVSHHLALLRVSGIIQSRREGKHNFYSLVDAGRDSKLVASIFGVRKPLKTASVA